MVHYYFSTAILTGLGPTVSELGDIGHAKKFEKTCFSMILPQVEEELKKNQTKSVVLCGIETQACIFVSIVGDPSLHMQNL